MSKIAIYAGHAIIVAALAYMMLSGPPAPAEGSGSSYLLATGNVLFPEEIMTFTTARDEKLHYEMTFRHRD